FIVNDRLDIALASGADGVHLGQDDLPLKEARKIVPRSFIIGVSVGTVGEAERAEKEGADYLGVGPVYQTGTKTDAGPVVGLSLLRLIRSRTSLPLVAIGGITYERVPEVIASGADGVAVISAVVCSQDITSASRRFAELVGSALAGRPGIRFQDG
ncbi:MAG: thiamine phosphate synthase, partial [Methanospirillum sp.]|nr:thiamine phosphate synthase [Methanospirillum sp.]